jgi:hypothetical protein
MSGIWLIAQLTSSTKPRRASSPTSTSDISGLFGVSDCLSFIKLFAYSFFAGFEVLAGDFLAAGFLVGFDFSAFAGAVSVFAVGLFDFVRDALSLAALFW